MEATPVLRRGPMARDLRDWKRWSSYQFLLKTFNPASGKIRKRRVEVYSPFKETAQVGAGLLPGETIELERSPLMDALNRIVAPLLSKKLKSEELAAFFETMAIGLDRSGDTGTCLEASSCVVKTPLMRGHIAALRHLISNGYTLPAAMAALPGFSRMHVAVTEAGAASLEGGLSKNFEELSKRLSATSQLTRKLAGALVYPATMLVGAFGVSAYIAIGVVPKYADLYKDLGADLPFLTKLFKNLGTMILQHGVSSAACMITLIIAASLLIKKISNTPYWDRMVLRVPVIGRVVLKLALMRALQVYSLLTKAGMKGSDVYTITGDSADNWVVKRFFNAVYARVMVGVSPEAAMAREWPALGKEGVLLAGRVSIGNKSGRTEDLLESLAQDYYSSAEATLNALPQLIAIPVYAIMAAILMPAMLALTLPMPMLIARQLEMMAHQQ